MMATDTMLELKRACISGIVPEKAGLMARRFSRLLGISLIATRNRREAARQSDNEVTARARAASISQMNISRGPFIAATGADSQDKQELAPSF